MDSLLDRLTRALAGRYAVERELGRGGMAVVYLAQDLKHHRQVAIKVLKPELAEAVGAHRFLQEIEIVANLTHPNILPLHDSGADEALLYYVMPYVTGESLRKRIDAGPMPIPEALAILAEVLDGLAEAHAKGIVHRDVKPDNVLLAGRHALLTDFGVAKAVSDATGHQTFTATGLVLGTPTYMAPEQAAADRHSDARADIYAVGVMAYEMLTGAPPFPRATTHQVMAAHIGHEPESMRSHNAAIPPELDAIVLKCLAKNPEDRWQSAAGLLEELDPFRTPASAVAPAALAAALRLGPRRLAGAAVIALVLLLAGATGLATLVGGEGSARATERLMRQIEQYVQENNFEAAYRLAKSAETRLPPASLAEIWPQFSMFLNLESDPPGARVLRRPYSDSLTAWEELGVTPIQDMPLPSGASLLRLELEGYTPVDRVLLPGPLARVCMPPLDAPPNMVLVDGGVLEFESSRVDLGDFFLDRFEVTNRQFKRFVDAGGYTRREYWEHPIRHEGQVIPWAEAMARFTDRTGRTGPATWLAGHYPDGEDDHPVTGVSWYEAAAYARFAGKSLPTIYHWRKAYDPAVLAHAVPLSNIEGAGMAPVGRFRGMSRYGAFDMAGNAREWVFNQREDQRLIIGGGWNDPDYLAGNLAYSQPPLDRSPTNGFRLALYSDPPEVLARARQPVAERPRSDFENYRPPSDALFEVYRRMYAYDPLPLNALIESVDTARHWIRQKISFDAAYGGERMLLYLYLPRTADPPWQTVVYFPGAFAVNARSIDRWRTLHFDFLLKAGRAVAFPVYKGTFERHSGLVATAAASTNIYREHVIAWVKDTRRTVEYLGTRSEIDAEKLGYYGFSWGGRMAPIMLVMEPRIKAAVLYVAGIDPRRAMPEADNLTYLTKVRTPVLMLNGRFDDVFPLETSARPMFELLGTSPEHKRHVVSDGGHFVPRQELIRESLHWFDRYLGRVQ